MVPLHIKGMMSMSFSFPTRQWIPLQIFHLPSTFFVLTAMVASFFLVFSACSRDRPGRVHLVVYSTHGKELLTEFEQRFERQHPEIDVRWLDMGSQDVLDRVRSEKENPQADLWWGAPSVLFQQAEGENLLQAYSPSWASQISADSHSPNRQWYGTYFTPEVIAYNNAALKVEEVPRDWDDLLDLKWKNQLIMRDPLASGTMRTIFCAMILRSYRDTGSPQAGYQWLRKLDANTKDYVANLTMLSQKLARREGLITLWNMPDIELQRERYHYPLDYVIPRSGTPVVTDGIAILARAKNVPAATDFYEFVTTRENLILAARKYYRIPCRKDIAIEELPAWMTRNPVPTMEVDWKVLEDKSNEWMRYWDTNIRNSSK
jgi:iron(III) transport system substrate-binding protein